VDRPVCEIAESQQQDARSDRYPTNQTPAGPAIRALVTPPQADGGEAGVQVKVCREGEGCPSALVAWSSPATRPSTAEQREGQGDSRRSTTCRRMARRRITTVSRPSAWSGGGQQGGEGGVLCHAGYPRGWHDDIRVIISRASLLPISPPRERARC